MGVSGGDALGVVVGLTKDRDDDEPRPALRCSARQSRCLICLHPILARSSKAVCAALEDHWRVVHPEAWQRAEAQGRALGIIWGA